MSDQSADWISGSTELTAASEDQPFETQVEAGDVLVFRLNRHLPIADVERVIKMINAQMEAFLPGNKALVIADGIELIGLLKPNYDVA